MTISVLDDVYKKWLDSVSYKESFERYLDNYKLPSDIDIWTISPTHPFELVDEQWLKIVGENINNKTTLPNYLSKINQRIQSKQAKTVGITFWADVKTLLEFDPQTMTTLSSFAECVTFYIDHFYKLDTAIRNLYTEFSNQKELLAPFQVHYQQITSIFLDKWFQFFDGYQERKRLALPPILNFHPVI